jgi:hypothetical protein
MSDQSEVIIRDKPLAPGEDYALLRAEGLRLIEQLAHEKWTDFNTHDPGITLLEVLCYAIADLGYRTQFELKDLLTREQQGTPYSVGQFHTAADILSSAPVSFDDLRKVLLQVPGIRNAFISPNNDLILALDEANCRLKWPETGVTTDTFAVNGLLNVCIEFEETVTDLRAGPADLGEIPAGSGTYLPAEGQGLQFRALRDVVLETVHVYADCTGTVCVRLGQGGEWLKEWEFEIEAADEKTPLALNYLLPYDPKKGIQTWELVALSPEGKTIRLFAHRGADFPMEGHGYLELIGGVPAAADYFFFYDWVFSPSEKELQHGHWAHARVGPANHSAFASDYVPPTTFELVFDAETPLVLEAIHLFANPTEAPTGRIALELADHNGHTIHYHELDIRANDRLCKLRVPLCWEIPACQGYALRARSLEGGVELSMNLQAAFPYQVPGAVALVGGRKSGQKDLRQVYPFFFDWEISFRLPPDPFSLTKTHVRKAVLDALMAHRGLCEDLAHLQEAGQEEVGIYADIHLMPGADADQALGAVWHALETYVKPPFRYYSLEEMVEKGYSTDEIFNGPLLRYGFLDPAEFEENKNRSTLYASDIINLLTDIPGVETVKSLRMVSYTDGDKRKEEAWALCLCTCESQCRTPNFSPERSKICFFRNRQPLGANLEKAKAAYEEIQSLNAPLRLSGKQYDLPVPVGQDRQLGNYLPAQTDLPANYLTGVFEAPDSQPELRKAQSKQLKAYLLFFEQILANYLSQLDHFHELFNWVPQARVQTYFSQRLGAPIAGIEALYQEYEGLKVQLDGLAETPGEALERRHRFMEHVLARFGEQFTDYSLLLFGLFNRDETTLAAVVRDQERFLENYPALSRDRSLGYDYRQSAESIRSGGYQRRVSGLLGMIRSKKVTKPDGFRLRQHENEAWTAVIRMPDERGLDTDGFTTREVISAEMATGLIDLGGRFGRSESNYRLVSVEDECNPSRWALFPPCAGDDAPAIGFTPDDTPASRDRAIDWFRSHPPVTEEVAADLNLMPDLGLDAFVVEETGEGTWRFVVNGEYGVRLFESTACAERAFAEQLLDAAIRHGHDAAHYVFSSEKCTWQLVRTCAGEPDAIYGQTTDPAHLLATFNRFAASQGSDGLHVVEHVLLRPHSAEDPLMPVYLRGDCPPVKDPYSFRATVLLPAWTARGQELAFRAWAESVLRSEAPAHVWLDIRWVSFTDMVRFESLFTAWSQSLAALPAPGRIAADATESLRQQHRELTRQLTQCLHTLENLYPVVRLANHALPSEGDQPSLGQISLGAS